MKPCSILLVIAVTACSTGHLASETAVGQMSPIVVASAEASGLPVDERSRPYYECLAKHVDALAAANSTFDTAFEASLASCISERSALYDKLLRIEWDTTDGSRLSSSARVDSATLMLRLIESGIRSKLESLWMGGGRNGA